MRLLLPLTAHRWAWLVSTWMLATQGTSLFAAPPAVPTLPLVPAGIAAPKGSHQKFCAQASGVQVYQCANDPATGSPWSLKAPEAQLTVDNGSKIHHFGDASGVYWQSAADNSKIAAVSKTAVPHPGSIPWLLVTVKNASATPPPPASQLGDVLYVQRLNTTGGVAPKAACKAGDADQKIAYTARYCFYSGH